MLLHSETIMLPTKTHYSLAEAADLIKCQPNDLLHYAAQKLIVLYVGVPDGVILRVYDEWKDQDMVPFLLEPQLLALQQSHCLKIEVNGKTEQSNFPEGYLIDSTGQMRKLRPGFGRHELDKLKGVYWRTYKNDKVYPLELLPTCLFVLHSDLTILLELNSTAVKSTKHSPETRKATRLETTKTNNKQSSSDNTNISAPRVLPDEKKDDVKTQSHNAAEKNTLKDNLEPKSDIATKMPNVLRLKQVKTRTGLSRSTIYDKMNTKSPRYDPSFPKRINLGAAAVGWIESDINAWIEKRKKNTVV